MIIAFHLLEGDRVELPLQTVKCMPTTYHSVEKKAGPSTSHINCMGNEYLQESKASYVELLILRLAISMAN